MAERTSSSRFCCSSLRLACCVTVVAVFVVVVGVGVVVVVVVFVVVVYCLRYFECCCLFVVTLHTCFPARAWPPSGAGRSLACKNIIIIKIINTN